MNFGPNHYVPVLKVKQGEKAALQAVAPRLRGGITPLLEIVVRKADSGTLAQHLTRAFKGLPQAIQGYRRCLLDAREIAPDGAQAAADVFARAAGLGMVFTPVTGVSRAVDVAAALAHRAHGTAIRLTRDEFEGGNLEADLRSFVQRHGLQPADVDLVVDLGAVDEMVRDGVTALAEAFLGEVPDPLSWRTLTLSASSFPLGMGVVDRNKHADWPRSEWLVWRDTFHANRRTLPRLPSYSDCAIQHPKGVEDFDFRTMHVSAAIRYARPETWLLIKGESTKIRPPSEQFPELAVRLALGQFRPQFCGAGHCEGCRKMMAAAQGAPNLGSAGAWRRLGTIHHITTVAEGLAALPWP